MDVTSTAAAAAPRRSALRLACEVVDLYRPLGARMRAYVAVRLLASGLIATERLVPRDGDVLDLGCGYGTFAHLLRLESPGRRVHGIDLSLDRIEAARRTAPPDGGLSFVAGDARSIPASSFPVIVVVDLLHHMPYAAQEELLTRAVHVLRPGGWLVVKDLERRPLWKYLFHYFEDWISYGGQPLYFRGREEMVGLLDGLGLEVEVVPIGRWRPYPLVLYRCQRREEGGSRSTSEPR